MPSGPAWLHECWGELGPYPGHADSNALAFLEKRGLRHNRGVFILPVGRDLNALEDSALDYLFMEWDFACERETPAVAKADRNPEGQDRADGLGAKHESGGPEGICPKEHG